MTYKFHEIKVEKCKFDSINDLYEFKITDGIQKAHRAREKLKPLYDSQTIALSAYATLD